LESGAAPYAQRIQLGKHAIVADEAVTGGGADAGPAPYALLLASLAACTSITLRMYADRKGWDLGAVRMELLWVGVDGQEHIERPITRAPSVTTERRARLAETADKTPVTRTILRGTPIKTTIA